MPGECPFCAMHDNLEHYAIDFLMGSSVGYMESDIRMKTNKTGFCKKHYSKLFHSQNHLGLALMLHTHLKEIIKSFDSMSDSVAKEKKSFFRRENQKSEISEYYENLENSCFVCDMIDNSYEHYINTFFMLFEKEQEVREKLKNTAGFCLGHFAMILDVAPKKLSNKALNAFYEIVIPLQKTNLNRLEQELDWFTKKFDYRFNDEPWKTSKDAVERAIAKIASLRVREKN